MPDPTLEVPEHEQRYQQVEGGQNPYGFPEQLGPHDFVESEFAGEVETARGRCDKCGSPRDAAIHNWVDPQVRQAMALERLADSAAEAVAYLDTIARALDRLYALHASCTLPLNLGEPGARKFRT